MKYIIVFPFVDSELEAIILDCIDDADAVQRAAQHACWFIGIDPKDTDLLNEIRIAALPEEYDHLKVDPIEFNLTKYIGRRNAH